MSHWSIDRTLEALSDSREKLPHDKAEVVQGAILITLVEILAELRALNARK